MRPFLQFQDYRPIDYAVTPTHWSAYSAFRDMTFVRSSKLSASKWQCELHQIRTLEAMPSVQSS